MGTINRFFKGSILTLIAGLVLAYIAGESFHLGGPKAVFIALILSVLEVSLSFDNAVVNATVLKDMDKVWRHRFMTWGMLIAVFGMRIVFPILIVAIIAGQTPWDAFFMAINQPAQYAETLTSAHVVVAGFGGTFLLMVFLKFFLDKEKDVHWISMIEAPLSKVGRMHSFEIVLCITAVYMMSRAMPHHEQLPFVLACLAGLACYLIVDGFSALLENEEEEKSHANGVTVAVARTGLSAFLYLEVLDASFSFDGVIGAFALSNNIFIIAIGLGVGAMFVRSLTIMFVEKETLDAFRYLEHGAFYAIGALAAIMYLGTVHEISEVVTGLIGAGFIAVSLISSIRHNKKAIQS